MIERVKEFPTLTIIRHPLVQHKLTILRDRGTETKHFKELVDEIAMLMAYEATSELPLEPRDVNSPLEKTSGWHISGKKLTLVPILRAGLGMVEGILRLVPSARVGHIGLYRDHGTLQPVDYYFKVPGDTAERDFFLLDPMLATGGSAAAAVSSLKKAGATRIRFLCIVAAPEGVRYLSAAHPDVQIYCAALDRQLNGQGYILPGLGDAGDRLFGTRWFPSWPYPNHSRGFSRCCSAASITHCWFGRSTTSPATASNQCEALRKSPIRRQSSPTRYVSIARSSLGIAS
jgi:uracil phosphoribosyltransferase